ncbi:MAG: phosphate ABC transporter substrate-binding protein PstS [Epsilonproteobacteria bacterium]|nr:phosphate ABC transporter substrate-binding protein PstS [Campylobacterota bacterium]
MKRVLKSIFMLALLLIYANSYARSISFLGAGSTFAYPLYSKMFDVYHDMTGIKVNYQAIGSGAGQRQIIARVVDFGGSDAFMSDAQMSKAPAKLLHIPTALGAVVMTYNLNIKGKLRLTPAIIAGIYLGKIKKWNDNRIKSINPNLNLPAENIVVVHRSDGSGTTFIFTDYLSKISKDWKRNIGRNTSVAWPVGIGGKGNSGVAGLVKQIPGAFGYVELIYASSNNMPMGYLRNSYGKFVYPTLASVTVAANIKIPADTRVSLTDTASPNGYPIAGMTWLLVYQEQHYLGRSKAKAKAFVKLIWWMTHAGQKYTKPLEYSPLPKSVVRLVDNILQSMTYDGKPIIR